MDYALELGVKMADEEAEQDRGGPGSDAAGTVAELRRRLQQLQAAAARSFGDAPVQSSAEYCQEFCRVSFLPASKQLASCSRANRRVRLAASALTELPGVDASAGGPSFLPGLDGRARRLSRKACRGCFGLFAQKIKSCNTATPGGPWLAAG